MQQKCENENCSKFGELITYSSPNCSECDQPVTALVDRPDHDFDYDAWTEITEKLYWYFLEVLPPSYGPRGMFAVGEPLCDNEQGKTVYTICRRTQRKYFAINGTLEAMYAGKLGFTTRINHDVLPTVQEPIVSN